MMHRLSELLFDTSLDLSMSMINYDDPGRLVVTTRLGAPRICLGLLFGIPCLILLFYALSRHGIYLLLAPLFCPPFAILGLLFGLTKQSKTFIPSLHKAVKSASLLGFDWHQEVSLPKDDILLTYKTLSSWGSDMDCYFYCLDKQGVNGLGFSVARNEEKRDDFAIDLAKFIGYNISDCGEQPQR